jgi:hypothetical protein
VSAAVVVGGVLATLGALMALRGAIYVWRPTGAMAQKRRRVNLQRGFTTDMAAFGVRVRRLGVLVLLTGLFVIGWHTSGVHDAELGAVDVNTPAPTADS